MTSVALLLFVLGAASALPRPQFSPGVARNVPYIVSRHVQSDDAGQYTLSIVESDGKVQEETGVLVPNNEGTGYVLVKTGHFKYTSPEGTPVDITYSADQTGFHPQGHVIPVAPVDHHGAF